MQNPTSCLTWEKMKDGCITYDYDDIFYCQTEAAVRAVGVRYEDLTDFHLSSNPKLSKKEVERILAYYYDEESYRDIDFLPGVEDILRPQLEFGVRVVINTNSGSQKIMDLKYEQLSAKVPELKREDFLGRLITHVESRQKEIDPRTQIFIDDSPYNIRMSPAPLNIMRQMPWNMSQRARMQVAGKNPLWFETLREIVDFNYATIKSLYATYKDSIGLNYAI